MKADALDGPLPRLLVSVRDAREADLVATLGPCLVDAKDPESGALGALTPGEVEGIVAAVARRALTSAVAGEPRRFADLLPRVAALASTGVDLVKVAWPGQDEPDAALPPALAGLPCPVIAVFFAEANPDAGSVARAAEAGFAGAMIDTAAKDGRGLLDHLGHRDIAAFVTACRSHGLVSGLAGSLRLADIPGLAALQPTYLGFRGGLCEGGDRRRPLDPARIADAMGLLGRSRPGRAVA